MQALEAAVARLANPWPLRRDRAAELAERYPHAVEMLRLYQALAVVQERAFEHAQVETPPREDIANVAATRVLPLIVDATVSSGPVRLRDGVVSVFCSADLVDLVQRWLDQEALSPFETYLARASTSPLLEAVNSPHPALPRERGREIDVNSPDPTLPRKRGREIDVNSPHPALPRERGMEIGLNSTHPALPGERGRETERNDSGTRCPNCGGLPQLSYFAISGEALVSGPRYLVCSRCANNWVFSRMTCAGCGESTGTKLPIYQEQERFPHARVDGCQTCHKYLLTFDLRRETRAVPVVDEIAALPLDLFARNQGLTKITPNLMGN